MGTLSRRQQMLFAILFIVLVLLTFTQRRLAELDFDSTGVVRIENNEKPDGDEIFNRLVFVDDTAAPPGTWGRRSLSRWPRHAGRVLPCSRRAPAFGAPRSSVLSPVLRLGTPPPLKAGAHDRNLRGT
jgi:hypothetical protein